MNNKLKLEQLNRISAAEFKDQKKFPVTVILDNIRSLHNIGSFFRTCDGLNIKELVLCGITAQPPHRDIRKTALGASETVNWSYYEQTEDFINLFKSKEGGYVYAAEQTEQTTPLHEVKWTEKECCIVFGNEVEGVSEEVLALCDEVLEIPQFGTKHSFNVSVSGGIILWNSVLRFI